MSKFQTFHELGNKRRPKYKLKNKNKYIFIFLHKLLIYKSTRNITKSSFCFKDIVIIWVYNCIYKSQDLKILLRRAESLAKWIWHENMQIHETWKNEKLIMRQVLERKLVNEYLIYRTFLLAFSQQKATYQQPSKQRKGRKIQHCDCHYSNIFLFIKIIAKFCLIKFSKNFPYEKTFVVFLSLWKVKQS